jgi:hypothetical protein
MAPAKAIHTDPLIIKSGLIIGTKSLVRKPRKARFVMSKAKKEVKDSEEKVMIVALATGEQVVGKVSENVWSSSTVNIKNPAVLVAAEKGLGMAPWLMYTTAEKDGVTINTDKIMFVAEPRIEIVNQYNAQYGNGLVLPSQGIQAPAPELTLAT